MSRRGLMAGVAGAALAAAGAAAQPAAADPAPAADPYLPTLPHQAEAEQLVDYLRNVPWTAGQNQYKIPGRFDDQPTRVAWGRPGHPEEFGVLAQCASFLTLVLERAYGADTAYGWATPDYFRSNFFYPEHRGDSSKLFPNAEEYRSGFANAAAIQHFTAVTKPVNLKPGDLVAIDYNEPNSPYTGHIVMIRKRKGTFASSVDSKVGTGVVPYIFEVIDCTSEAHGDPVDGTLANYEAYPDTRWTYTVNSDGSVSGTANTGVGYGHMIFYADPDTKLFAGYRSSVNSSTPHKVSARPIAAARVYL